MCNLSKGSCSDIADVAIDNIVVKQYLEGKVFETIGFRSIALSPHSGRQELKVWLN